MERVKLVINHTNEFHKVDVSQVTEVTGLDVFWSVPFDKAILRGGQVGMPMVMSKPKSRGARSMIDLALAISGGKREKRWFGRGRPIVERQETFRPVAAEGANE
jgi:MinD superfamily P-loop ATPase